MIPSSAERRVTTSGPKGTGPSCTGPQRSSSQARPLRSGGAPDPGWVGGSSRSSSGGRCRVARPVPPAGSRVVSSPTSTASNSRRGRLRRQIRRGRPLTRVSRSSRPTRASRQRGPAKIGVTRKATVQASLSRGSIRFSQLPRPGPPSSTYWPIGSWRSQSIQRPRPVERASSFSASRCCLPRQNRRMGDPSKPRPSRICRST